MMSQLKNIHPIQLIVSLIIILISFFLSFASFDEFYGVGILHHTKDYPFGAEGPVARLWQYENASNYAIYNLICGILYLIVFAVNTFSLLVVNRKYLNISIGFAFFVYLFSKLLENL